LTAPAPSKVLVVNNTMAVHNQIEEFLQGMKKSTAQAKMKRDPQVLPAQLPLPGDWVLARFASRLSRDGFIEEDGEIWSRDGWLIAQSRQLALLQAASQ